MEIIYRTFDGTEFTTKHAAELYLVNEHEGVLSELGRLLSHSKHIHTKYIIEENIGLFEKLINIKKDIEELNK